MTEIHGCHDEQLIDLLVAAALKDAGEPLQRDRGGNDRAAATEIVDNNPQSPRSSADPVTRGKGDHGHEL